MSLLAINWAQILDDLRAHGVARDEIHFAIGAQLTHNMIRHYRRGVQPLHWRGERLLALWCSKTHKARDSAPTQEIERGHRVAKRTALGPRLQLLPAWPAPVAVPVEVKCLKRRKVAA